VLIATAGVTILVVTGVVLTTDTGTEAASADAVEIAASPRTQLLTTGETVPAFSAPALAGGDRIAWSDHVGTPTVLAIWAPWCPACQAELPVLDRVVKEHPGVRMLTIVTAIGDHPGPSPEEYLADHGLTFPVAVDDADGTLASGFGLANFPSVLFVDSTGTVVRSDVGVIPEDSVRETVTSLT
jgi:thiol-disulfide isomerase/thioredoxin